MAHDGALSQLPLVDRLELLAFDAWLTGTPESLVQAIWQALDRLGRGGEIKPLQQGATAVWSGLGRHGAARYTALRLLNTIGPQW
jgi:hypothetical protein